MNAVGGTPVVQRYLPYGASRSTSGTPVTDRGWIGQTNDASTGLQFLNARYYDPTIGRFTAIDPLADLTQPGSLDGYGYGRGSPVTLSDPSGLDPDTSSAIREIVEDKGGCTYSSGAACYARIGKPNTGYTAQGGGGRSGSSGSSGILAPGEEVPPWVEIPQEIIDQLLSLDISKIPIGLCYEGGAAFVGAGELGSCWGTLGGDVFTTAWFGFGVGSPGASVGAGSLLTNADKPTDLAGWSVCASGGAGVIGGGAVSICGGVTLDENWGIQDFTGTYSAVPTGTLVLQPGASASGTLVRTEVNVVFSWDDVVPFMNDVEMAPGPLDEGAPFSEGRIA